MKKIIKKVWTDSVCSKVIAAGIIALIVYLSTLIYDWFPGFLSFLFMALDFFLMKTLIPNWLLVVFSICALIVICRYVINAWSLLFTHKRCWTDYKSDVIFDIKWSWEYDSEGHIFNLTPFCKECCFEIVINENQNEYTREYTTRYICESCGYIAGPFSESSHKIKTTVEKTIYHRIRTGTCFRIDNQ